MDSALLSTGRTYYFIDQQAEQIDKHATPLLCVHGFPDFSYGWRNQIPGWVAGGYRVIAPDMLGCGKTDMPLEASAYSTKRLCDDLAALLDHLGIQTAVVVGHDWGAFIAGRFALWHPERLLALAILSLPYTPPLTQFVPLEDVVQNYPSYGYQLYFASEQSSAEVDAHISQFYRMAFRSPVNTFSSLRPGEFRHHLLNGTDTGDSMMSEKELEHYIAGFPKGMHGALSYYRVTRIRFEEERDGALPSKLPSDLPVLFLYGTKDATCPPIALGNMSNFIDRLKVVPIPNIGHWITIQAPETVMAVVLEWVQSTLGTETTADRDSDCSGEDVWMCTYLDA